MLDQTTRRDFLLGTVAGIAAFKAGWCGRGMVAASASEDLTAARKQTAHRRRRVIYNNDGDDIWARGADTIERFLAVRHDPLLKMQVDSIFYCTTQSFNLFTHETSVAERFLSRDASFANNNLPTFLEHKTDGLRMSCAFARRHNVESMWSLRMNDIHDAWTPPFVSQWKKDDPRRVMSALVTTQSFDDRRRLWSLVDFEHPDVEPRLVAIVEEVLRNYPVDGIELDWLRAPIYFRSHYEGGKVSARQVDVLTRVCTSLRQVVLQESRRQGKPFLLAARVPVTIDLCRMIGIDIAAWLKAGLIDLLAIGGGYVVFDQPVAGLIELGHRHDVPVYPCLSQSGLVYRPPRGNGEVFPPAGWFAAAERCFDAGADGIYVFNLFPGPYSDWKNTDPTSSAEAQRHYARTVLSRVGSPETLRDADKLYSISDAGNYMPAHYWSKDAEQFENSLPKELKAGEATSLPELVVAGKLPQDHDAVAELRIDVTGLSAEAPLKVAFNGTALSHSRDSDSVAQVRRFHYSVPVFSIRAGANALSLSVADSGVKTVGAELWLRRE
jgi:hypothetical protein